MYFLVNKKEEQYILSYRVLDAAEGIKTMKTFFKGPSIDSHHQQSSK
jgi:hypothetical protein